MSGSQSSRMPTFHTVTETADRLKVSVKTVRRLIVDQKLRAYRFNKQLRISDEDLLAYIQSCRD